MKKVKDDDPYFLPEFLARKIEAKPLTSLKNKIIEKFRLSPELKKNCAARYKDMVDRRKEKLMNIDIDEERPESYVERLKKLLEKKNNEIGVVKRYSKSVLKTTSHRQSPIILEQGTNTMQNDFSVCSNLNNYRVPNIFECKFTKLNPKIVGTKSLKYSKKTLSPDKRLVNYGNLVINYGFL